MGRLNTENPVTKKIRGKLKLVRQVGHFVNGNSHVHPRSGEAVDRDKTTEADYP